MNDEMHDLLLALPDAERTEYHRDRAETLEPEAATLRQRLRELVGSRLRSQPRRVES